MVAVDSGAARRVSPDVIVVGSINVDLIVHASRLPRPGETVTGGRFERAGGGKGANQAVAAARTGAAVALVGAVGADEHGDHALAELRGEGIDVSAVRRLPTTATGVALITVDAAGDNQIAVASGANHALDGDTVTAGLAGRLEGHGCLVASFELGDAAVLRGADAARKAGWALLVNPAPARPIPPALLALRPTLTPNETEARQLTGDADLERAARILTRATGAPVVITLGARGVLLADDDRVATIAAPSVRVVDTTGAGDTFNGALAAQLAAGAPVDHGARVAVVAAALSVTSPGARAGMPTGDALDAALSERSG